MQAGAPTTTRVELSDGGAVLIGPLSPDDRERYVTGMARASAEALYTRFMSPVARLTESQLRYLLEVDHRDHEALLVVDEASGDAVGVGRFVRSAEDGTIAEVAVLVIDEWHGRGVGTALCRSLADHALDLGISRFEATVLMTNKAMLTLLESIGSPRTVSRDGPTVTLEVTLPSTGTATSTS